MDSPITLKFGRWQDVLQNVVCDALIVDAPYSERTHSSHDASDNGHIGEGRDNANRQVIAYDRWTPESVAEFVGSWSERVRGWFVSITDHVLAPVWERALQSCGRYVFAPLPFVETGSRVRLAGDGPSSWTCWVIVARPTTRDFQRWGTLQGSYVAPNERKPVMGGKPLGLMRSIVRDYTRPGDLVCDPCAGGGTTLLAAAVEGRRAIGAECMREHYDIAQKRIAKGFTPALFAETSATAAEQTELFGEWKAS